MDFDHSRCHAAAMDVLRATLRACDRPALLDWITRGISEMTIRNRFHYNDASALLRLIEGNEAIHRLNGHLHDLIDPDEALTESRIDDIVEQLLLLPDSVLERIFAQ